MIAYIVKNDREAKEAILQLEKMGYVNENNLTGSISSTSVYFTEGTSIKCYNLADFKKCFPSCAPTTVTQNDENEKRNISITLKQAREWYHGNNSALKELALTAYTEEELGFTINDVYCKVSAYYLPLYVPSRETLRFKVKAKLDMIAACYNGDWEMKEGKTGYFIGRIAGEDVTIMKHVSAKYEGVTYFKNRKDAERAMKLLEDEIKYLL